MSGSQPHIGRESDHSSLAVFICSSDSRLDVLTRVLPAQLALWADCPYPIYVGLNSPVEVSPLVKTLVASPSEWRLETASQIAQLPQRHVIMMLDDYLILKPVDQARLAAYAAIAVNQNLPYLRLLPFRQSIFQQISRSSSTSKCFSLIPKGRPFYSGLQIAIWQKDHLISLLAQHGSIWQFEHITPRHQNHYVIHEEPPIRYSHLVEKGRWQPYARRLLASVNLSADLGKRPVWPAWMHIRLAVDEAKFLLLGYANH
jgi:hypothetical protein